MCDFLMLIIAGIIGGLVGGSIGFTLARRLAKPSTVFDRAELFPVPQQSAKILPFNRRELDF